MEIKGNKNNRYCFYLIFILILAAFLRFYEIAQVPPSLNWDEVAIGYNAYSILKTGRDEWGRKFPLLGFESFGEYKLPTFIYATIPGVWLFGLNEFGVRFMPALFGILGVLVTFLLAKELFKNEKIALLSALIMAVDIWHLQITRAAFEAGLAQLFISLSILFLLKSRIKWYFLPISFLFACLSVYTYNSSRVFIPLFFFLIFVIHRQFFLENIKGLVLGLPVILIFAIPLLVNLRKPVTQGRYQLISIQADPGFVLRINQARGELLRANWPPILARVVHNKVTHYVCDFGHHYFSHFTPDFLFIRGAEHTQQSLPGFGQFLYVWALPMGWGLYILAKRWKQKGYFPSKILLVQILLSPIATSTTINANPHALRTFCALPAWQIIIAFGLFNIGQKLKNIKWKEINILYPISVIFSLALLLNFAYYWHQYYGAYPKEYASDWQYGYKQAVNFVRQNKDQYDKIFFTRHYGEPYIFFLFYSQYPPAEYQTANKKRAERYNWVWVDQIDKFYFPDFSDPGDSVLDVAEREKGKLLFVGSPGDIQQEWMIEKVYFPNGKVAFEIGSAEGKVK